jgi:RNA polymerase sigma-70 factor, ECF subfamily
MLGHNFLSPLTTLFNDVEIPDRSTQQPELNIGFSKSIEALTGLFLVQIRWLARNPYRFAKLDSSRNLVVPQSPTGSPMSNDPKFDEKTILKELPSLEPEVVTKIYDHFYPALYRYAHYRLSNPNVAEDIVSEVFLLLLEAVHKGRGPRNTLRGWLIGTLSNLINNYYRKAYKQPTEELNQDVPARVPDPGALLEMTHREESVRAALLKLTLDQQNVLALRFGSGYSLEETATAIGKRVNAVKQLQYRALESLRRHLGED